MSHETLACICLSAGVVLDAAAFKGKTPNYLLIFMGGGLLGLAVHFIMH